MASRCGFPAFRFLGVRGWARKRKECVRNESTPMETKSKAPEIAPVEKLAYNCDEACAALGIKRTTLWRLEKRGLISAVPGIRHKLWPVTELRRFTERRAA